MKTYIRNSYTPKIGDYCNALVIDKETNKQYLFDKDGVWSLITASTADFYTKEEVDGLVDNEAESRQTEDERIWDKINDIEMASDVVDVVGTFADLSTYDTEHLSDNDLVKVLQDETHGDAISYYRWSTTSSSFSYVGSEGPYYTQAQTDTLLDAKLDASDIDDYYDKTETDALLANKANVSDLASKQDTLTAGQNITITDNVISAASSTYSAGAGLNLNGTTFSIDANTVALKSDLPTNISQLTNDSGFITDATNSLSNYYLKSDTYTQGEVNSLIGGIIVPTKTSDLTNDSGFITGTNYATTSTGGTVIVGSGLSIANGVLSATGGGVADSVEWANVLNKPTNVSYWTNDAGYITSAALPTKTSDLTNDSGFITSAAIPTNVSQLTNDAGYITNATSSLSNYYTKSETYTQSDVNSLINSITVPTKTSDLTNDGSDGTSTYVEADELANYVTLDTDQSITGTKTINSVLKIQNGQGTGSLWVGGNVNSNTVSNNQRHLARIAVPSYSDISLGATLLGYDSSGDNDMHVVNKSYDVVSFGGMKKITNATSPMAIGFCVTDTRSATAAANKIYPLEMDANSARFNVQPNYNGTNLATVADLPTVPTATSDLTNDGSDGTSTYVEADELNPIATDGMVVLTYGTSTWQDFIDAYNENRVVYCRASLNADPSVGDKTRLAPMSYVDSETPTQVQFSFLRSLASLSDAQQTGQVFIYTLFNDDSWTVTTRELGTKVVAGTNMTSSYSNGQITLGATVPTSFSDLSGTVSSSQIAAGAITGNDNSDTAVGTSKIALTTIGTPNLRDSSVTTAKINNLGVTTAKLANGAVTGVTNTATAIGSAKLALATVGTPNLRDSAVSTAKIAASAVTTAKLAAGIVTLTRTQLYNNASGASGTITVSQAFSGFDEIEFWIIDGNSPVNQLIRTIPGDALSVVLDIPHPGGSSTVYWNIARWTWSSGGTTLTQSTNHYQKILGTTVTTATGDYIKIKRIIGIKYVSHT